MQVLAPEFSRQGVSAGCLSSVHADLPWEGGSKVIVWEPVFHQGEELVSAV